MLSFSILKLTTILYLTKLGHSIHRRFDLIVPKDQSKDLDAKLKQISIPSGYHEYPNSIFHVLLPKDLNDSYPKLLRFINKYWE